MVTKQALHGVYRDFLGHEDFLIVESFFKTVLHTKDITWRDLIHELKERRYRGSEDFSQIYNLYRYLGEIDLGSEIDDIR